MLIRSAFAAISIFNIKWCGWCEGAAIAEGDLIAATDLSRPCMGVMFPDGIYAAFQGAGFSRCAILARLPTFFDAIYWATVSLTTVGYGDIFAVSPTGRIITMLSSILGIAIVALPAGIIMAGYLDALNGNKQMQERNEQGTIEDLIGEVQELSKEEQRLLLDYIGFLKQRSN